MSRLKGVVAGQRGRRWDGRRGVAGLIHVDWHEVTTTHNDSAAVSFQLVPTRPPSQPDNLPIGAYTLYMRVIK